MFQYENSDLQVCAEEVARLGASMIGSEYRPGSPLEGHKAHAMYLAMAMHDLRNPDEYLW
jgi:hypothetical protein